MTPRKAADQRVRSLTLLPPKPIGVSEQTPRSEAPRARCGWTNFIHSAANPTDGRAIWQKCGRRHVCPHCGPRLRKLDLDHDLGNLRAAGAVVRKVIAKSAWVATRAKIKRAGGLRVAYPQPGGMLAVYATAGLTGAVPTDLAAAVTSDYDRMPEGTRILRCRAWALAPGRGKADRPNAWPSLGMSKLPPEQVPDVLKEQGLYRDQVPDRELSDEAWEAHNFAVPELDTRAFNRFAWEVGLYQPEPVRKRPRRAA